MTKPIDRRLTTPDERNVILAMRRTVTFPVASWDKRFFHHLLEMEDRGTESIHFRITDKEAPQLWRLAVRYRRQWCRTADDTRLLRVAESLAAPNFRKQQRAAREQERIDEMKRKYNEAMAAKTGPALASPVQHNEELKQP